jgi:hypothetical protein
LYLTYKDKKDVSVNCPSPMVVEFNRLVGVQNITTEIGNKNMVISFSGYDAHAVERISSNVTNNTLSLKVITKPGFKPANKDQLEVTYEGVNADLVILIGGSNSRDFSALGSKDFLDKKLVHIGTSEINLDDNREVISLAKPVSSVSEIVYELIATDGGSVEQDIATNLLMGLYEGSQNFSASNVSYETFRVAGELMKSGGKHMPKQEIGARMRMPVSLQNAMMMDKSRAENQEKQVESEPTPENKEGEEEPPKEWMQPPKIMKGTSVS